MFLKLARHTANATEAGNVCNRLLKIYSSSNSYVR